MCSLLAIFSIKISIKGGISIVTTEICFLILKSHWFIWIKNVGILSTSQTYDKKQYATKDMFHLCNAAVY